jgi:imidazolonepropionase-like amidohydrolase/predicted DNA-binding protein with PD1-like motif
MKIKLTSGIASPLVILVLLAFCPNLKAQSIVVLRNVNMIDGTGSPAQPNRTVVIEGDHIQSIATGQADTPSGAKTVEMRGQTIMPLIINTHGHLGMVKGTSSGASNQTEDNFRHQLLRYQDYGIGAVLSMGTDGPKFAEVREASRTGKLPGADVYSAGNGFGTKDGAPPLAMGFTNILRPDTPDEARKEVAAQVPMKPDFYKLWLDDFYGQYPKLITPEIYEAIIDEAHKHGLRVAAHLYHLKDARSLVADGVDVLAHSVRDGEVDDALIADMKKHSVAYIPTLSLDDFAFSYADSPNWVNEPFFRAALDPGVFEMITSPDYKAKMRESKVAKMEEEALPIAKRNLKKIYDAGILVALGTDSGATPIRVQGFAEHVELGLMVQAGLSSLQVISVATKNGAQLLRVADQYGTLEPGKKANFIVLAKDPSQDINNTKTIRAVWKNGVKVSDGPVRTKPSGQNASEDYIMTDKPASREEQSNYISPSHPIEYGKAPGMKVQLIRDGDAKEYAVIFAKGDEAFSGLMEFAKKYHVASGHFTAIGALSRATLGWFDLQEKMYRKIPINEQIEVLSMIGDFALYQGKPALHTHMTVGHRDGRTSGGHVIEAVVSPTLEVFVTVEPAPLKKEYDPETGLTLIALDGK